MEKTGKRFGYLDECRVRPVLEILSPGIPIVHMAHRVGQHKTGAPFFPGDIADAGYIEKCMFGWNAEKDRQWFPYFEVPDPLIHAEHVDPDLLSRAFDFWASR